jgi:hypothetical protein
MDSWFFLSFSQLAWIYGIAGPEEAKNLAGKVPPPDSNPFGDIECEKISQSRQALWRSSRQLADQSLVASA